MFVIDCTPLEVPRAVIQHQFASNGGQIPRQGQLTQGRPEIFTDLTPDLISVRYDLIQATPFAQPFSSGFWATFFNAGDVVGLVAGQRQEIDDLFRSDIEFFLDACAIHIRARHRVGQCRAVTDQLRHVLVAGGNNAIHTRFLGRPGKCTDNIIGFNAFNLQQGQAEYPGEIEDGLDLLAQFSWHRWAVCLVLRVKFVPEGRTFCVENNGDVLGFVLLEEALEHISHTE